MADDQEWQQASLNALAEHIVSAHHAYLYRQLPLISAMLAAVTRQHWRRHPQFLKVHALFHRMKAELEQHLMKEETAGFPAIHAYEQAPGAQLTRFIDNIGDHIAEHAGVNRLLGEIRQAAQDYQSPAETGADVEALFAALIELESDLGQHIHLENDILFVRVRQVAR